MGRPKHLLEWQGRTLLEQALAALRPHVTQVFLLGRAELPATCIDTPRIEDAPDRTGPLAGILAAIRHSPDAAWLIAACDHPRIASAAIGWLTAQRGPGRTVIIPCDADGQLQPLLAIYEPAIFAAIEALAARGITAPRQTAELAGAFTPSVPAELAPAFRSANSAADWPAM
ncbi:molybdopterin-guanine dinucleotide biosynthesis protein MobA [Phycisphaerae bacterium RAS1]|nr:molybdopterin-guanine dinucleotide biosynthesis protein MobA [Phycisphaerae bacterium RAS1]